MTLADLSQALELASQHRQAGRLREAEGLCRRVLAQNPNHPEALHLLGVLALQSGHAGAAIELIRRAVAVDPANAAYHGNLGMAYQAAGNWEQTIDEFREAARLRPDLPEAHFNLGAALEQRGRWGEAAEAYRAALQRRKDYPQALTQLGHALQEQGHLDQAVAAHRQALHAWPDFVRAMNNLGLAFSKMGRIDEAIKTFEHTMAAHPGDGEAYYNLGMIYLGQERFEKAIGLFQRSAALQPQNASTHYHLGVGFLESNRLEPAIASFRHALARMPTFSDARWNLGWALLKKGEWLEGWRAYEARFEVNATRFPQTVSGPLWDGGELAGRRILLHCEQGFGDSINMARFVPLVAARGGRVILQCQPELRTLFESLPDVDTLVSTADPLPPFDVHCPLMSLPGRLGITAHQLPGAVPYLGATSEKMQRWRAIGQHDGQRLKVGLVYCGRQYPAGRSIDPAMLSAFGRIPNVRFFSLQKPAEGMSEEPRGLDFPVVDCASELHDFSDTAALLMNLDLLISIDTAAAHLAGAMGRRVWMLLRHAPDWRWMLDRHDTPWYPTMTLFRQSERGNWSGPIDQVTRELTRLAKSWPSRFP